jgi:hypothetical protein
LQDNQEEEWELLRHVSISTLASSVPSVCIGSRQFARNPQSTNKTNKNKLHGLSPRANYTDRATTASRRNGCQILRIKDATWSA